MSKRTSKVGKKRASRARVLTPNLVATSAVLALSASGLASAQDPGKYFTETTSTAFPTAACADNPANKPGCFTSWMVLSDIDADGDLDLLFANGGDYYKPADFNETSAVYLNDGKGAFRDVTDTMFEGAKSRLRQVSVGDIDGDGDLDIYQPGGYGLDEDKLWVQTSPGVFQDLADLKLPSRLKSYAGASHFGDLDGDGDLDLIVADWGPVQRGNPVANTSWGTVLVYENDGLGNFAQLPGFVVPPAQDPTVGRTPIDIDVADIDGDFDLDILVNNRNGLSRIFTNDGSAFFTDTTVDLSKASDDPTRFNYPVKRGPYAYNQELCDIDGDGDLDMLIDNAAARPAGITRQNFTQILINNGEGRFEDQSRDLIFGEIGADDNAAKCADVNGDGFYDIMVSSLGSQGEKLLINDGTGQFNAVAGGFPIISDPSLGIDAADLNGDGIIDVVTGQGEGSSWIDRIYYGSGLSKPDVTPPKFRTIEKPVAVPGEPIVIRVGVMDAHTSETGEHVKSVSVKYQVDGGAPVTLKATFIGGDLFRVVIPAQANGTVLTVSPVAVDRQKLVSADVSFDLLVGTAVEPGDGDGSVGDGDGSVGDGDGSMGDGDGSMGDGDKEPVGDGDGDKEPVGDGDDDDKEPVAGGDGDSETPVSKSSDGCNVGSTGGSSNGLAMFGLFSLLLGRAFRRSRKAD